MNANRLLIVDDEPDVCDFVQVVAEKLGFEVACANNYGEFRTAYNTFTPTAILLDLRMPEVDGIELLRFLGKDRCDAKILLISGVGGRVLNAARTLGREHGLEMLGILEKPTPTAELRSALKQALREERSITEHDLEDAIAQNQLVLHYQPKVRLSGELGGGGAAPDDRLPADRQRIQARIGKWPIEGLEALVRWEHPHLGLLPPGEFIPMAETSGLIGPLTDHVLAAALEQMAIWRKAGFSLSIAVNLAPHLLSDLELPDRLSDLADKHGVDHANVILEITESGVMADVAGCTDVLSRLRLKGFVLSMDDFGTGYSSLVQLYRMPFNELKIDKSFVVDVATSDEAITIVRSVIRLAHDLGMDVCAEGVEDKGALDFLCAEKCDKAQGYYFSEPLPLAKLNRLLNGEFTTEGPP